jgi:siderophore ferric iron reductase
MYNTLSELTLLLNAANEVIPRLQGRVGDVQHEQLLCGSPDNPQRVAELYRYWQQQHPEAGRHYWAVRSWTLLIWQPIYLSVLAVHLRGQAPSLRRMGQSLKSGFVGGFCLPAHAPQQGHTQELIRFAAGQVHELVETQLDEFKQVADIYPKLARLLAADCAGAALLLAQRQLKHSNSQLLDLEQHWLDALQLAPRSCLEGLIACDGGEHLSLLRRACCQDFRRADGELCSSCPKLKPAERLARLQAELATAC